MPKHNQTSFKKGHTPLNLVAYYCTIKGCSNRHEAKGFCVKHYKRLKKYGNPIAPSRRDHRAGRIRGVDVLIPLGICGKDGDAIVSQIDKWVECYFWHKSNSGYATARINGRLVMMHRLLVDCPAGSEIDHINRNKLDNRRVNLRVVSRAENSLNVGLRNTNTSGYKGVSWNKSARKYSAQITHKGTSYYLGVYEDPQEAHGAYLKKAAELRKR